MDEMAHVKTRNFQRNVAALCERHGMVKRTADAAGITREYLSNVIHAKAVPTLDVALAIADALDVSLSDLTDGILEHANS